MELTSPVPIFDRLHPQTFSYMRDAALRTIVQAYQTKMAQWPLDDLVRLLAFDSADHTMEFLQHYGLTVVNDLVQLDREAVQGPCTNKAAVGQGGCGRWSGKEDAEQLPADRGRVHGRDGRLLI